MTSTFLEDIKNAVLILTPIATFLLALFTVNKWKKEYRGKILFDCSFKFLKSAYSLRDQFMSMRAPFILAGEMLQKTPDNTDNYEQENMVYYLNNRYKPFQEALNNFYSVFPEVEILLGKEVIKVAWDMNHIITRYNMAVNEYVQLTGVTNNHEHMAEVASEVFSNKTPDKLKDEMNTLIEKIESAVSEHLKLKF